jgi:hypothetical protein
LTNSIIGLFNFVSKKVKNSELENYSYKLRIVANNCHPSELDPIVSGIIKFSHENMDAVSKKKMEDLRCENFDIMKQIDENRALFSEPEIEEIWTRVHSIIRLALKIKSVSGM